MTVSIRRVLLGGLVAAIGLASGAAPAQDGDNEPLVIVPLEDADGEADGAGHPPAPATPDLDLEVETLEAVSAETAGTLDTKSGGFGHDMWRGSDGALVALVMPEIRGGAGSRVMTNLARRLLLTAGSAPEGDAGDLLGARIGRLVAIGRQDDVPGLIDSAGLRALTAAGHRGRIEALLLDGDNDAACQAARDALATGDDDTIALTLVFCQRLAGRHAAAELGLAVLRDAGAPVGERYLALDRGLARGRPVPLDSLEGVSPLLFAMTLATGAGLSPDRFAAAPAPILRAASMREALPLEVRLHAAERAVAAGAMEGAELAVLYGRTPFSDDEIAHALARAEDLAGPFGRALLYRAAARHDLPAGKAEALSAMLRHAAGEDGKDGFIAAARAIGEETARLTPDARLAWFSGDAAMALLAGGMPEHAARWWPLLEDRARDDAVAAAQVAALWPIYRLAFGEQFPDDGARMLRWWDAGARLDPGGVPAQAELYLALFAALDDRVAEALTVDALAAPPSEAAAGRRTGAAGRMMALDAAARDGRTGEIVLLSLALLGPDGPAEADAVVLRRVVEALRSAGLGREARLLAMEAAFANGI